MTSAGEFLTIEISVIPWGRRGLRNVRVGLQSNIARFVMKEATASSPAEHLKIVTAETIAELVSRVAASPRKRMNFNLHNPTDSVCRFLNAGIAGTYVRPHRHQIDKSEKTVPTKCGSVHRSVQQTDKVPKGLPTPIIVDLCPSATVGLASLLQG